MGGAVTKAGADLFFHRFGGRKDAAGFDSLVDFDEVGSVVKEVTLLLNTRSPFAASIGASRRTVLEYGLPDFSHFSPRSKQDAEVLANVIFEVVVAYEPRLVVESVIVDAPRPSKDCLSALISGYVRKRDHSMVPVRFPVSVGVAALSAL